MIQNKIDRYKILIRYIINKGIAENQRHIGSLLGYPNESYFSQLINGKVETPKDFTQKLKSLVPTLNSAWLLTGEGEMLEGEGSVSQSATGDNSTNINGNSNNVNVDALNKALDEISHMRSALTEALKKSQEREERLMAIIEKFSGQK